MDNKPSPACYGLIREFEGLELKAYLDPVGIPTLGYGHTRGVQLGDTCTTEQAEQWLEQDVTEFARLVNTALAVPVSQGQFDALVAWAYNVRGWQASTLLRKLNAGDVAGAAAEFCRWNKSGGRVLAGLTRRRAAERALFTA